VGWPAGIAFLNFQKRHAFVEPPLPKIISQHVLFWQARRPQID
jgi:hypothetical protein